jgi:hypothetical protein
MKEAKGLYQGLDDNLINLSVSPDCQNVDVSDGIISTRKGFVRHINSVTGLPQYYKIYKVMRFEDVNAGATGGYTLIGIYNTSLDRYEWYAYIGSAWKPITTDGTTLAMTTNDPREARHVMYLISGDPVIIITANAATNSIYKIYWSDADSAFRAAVLGGSIPINVNNICLHRERIWVSQEHGNSVFYSNAYDPEDWSTAGETGELPLVTNDNDFIIGLSTIQDSPVIFKKYTIHDIAGDIPSEYYVEQLMSTKGTHSPKSICKDGNNCFYSCVDGIYQFNGVEGNELLTDAIKDIMAETSMTYDQQAVLIDNTLYFSTTHDQRIIKYNIKKHVVEVINLNNFAWNQYIFDMIAPGIYYNNVLLLAGDSYVYTPSATAIKDDTANIVAYWNTPDTDFGKPKEMKRLTDISFEAWGTDSAGAAGGQVKITIYANKKGTVKTKEKTVTLQTTRKPHNVRCMIPGRAFKFKIENVSGSAFSMTPPVFKFDIDPS